MGGPRGLPEMDLDVFEGPSNPDVINARRRVEQLTAMLEAIPGAVIALDRDQRILFANHSAYRLFDVAPRSRTDAKLWEIVRYPALYDAVNTALANDGPYQTEFETLQPRRVLGFRSQPLHGEAGGA